MSIGEYIFIGFLIGFIVFYTLFLFIERYCIKRNYFVEYDDNDDVYRLIDKNRSYLEGRTIYSNKEVEEVYKYYNMIKEKNVGFPKKLKK